MHPKSRESSAHQVLLFFYVYVVFAETLDYCGATVEATNAGFVFRTNQQKTTKLGAKVLLIIRYNLRAYSMF